jgi:hypothetical protein
VQPLAVEDDGIGECPSYVDAEQHARTLPEQGPSSGLKQLGRGIAAAETFVSACDSL